MRCAHRAPGHFLAVDPSHSPVRIPPAAVVKLSEVVQFSEKSGDRTQAGAFEVFESGSQRHKSILSYKIFKSGVRPTKFTVSENLLSGALPSNRMLPSAKYHGKIPFSKGETP